ncbi:MAG: protein translocase subunit SecD [Planctomycetes bacterium]|nr:protein translocase subunit SecD [Planctomycetota bacterium]
MEKQPLWKPLLILAVLVLCGLGIYPPERKLKPGLDLAGGTTLLYQVNVPDGVNARSEIDETIAVLRGRVDPHGVRNLIWRQQAGNRIEIQMAQPQENVVTLRKSFIAAREALMSGNLSARDIDQIVRAVGAERNTVIERLSRGSAGQRKLLENVAVAEEALTAARKPYEQAQAAARETERQLVALPESDAKRAELNKKLQAQREKLYELTRAFSDARRKADTVRLELLQTNVLPADLDRVLALPVGTPEQIEKKKADAVTAFRGPALDVLIKAHPGREAEVRQVADAWAAYEKVKGPLDDPNDLIGMLRGSGVLEFRVAPSPRSLPEQNEYREQLRTRGPRGSARAKYVWLPVDDISSFAENRREREAFEKDPVGFFEQRRLIAQPYGDRIYILLSNDPDSSITQAQSGWALVAAYPTADKSNFSAVGFELNGYGGQLMGALTASHKDQPMAIVLDGRVMSAPNIQSAITTSGIITGGSGGFSKPQLDYLVRTLKAGSLRASLSENPISIQKVGPQFGQDNLKWGLRAAVISFVFVCVFMLCYYFVGGLIADFALAFNIVIILGIMSMIGATFTLPGIAGIILTIGMAVDANVLIYERIREELERKVPLKMAVRLGYRHAMSSIIDTHLTSIFTCVVLYYVGTADIKGFGLTLGIGLAASLFTAVFASRVVIDYYIAFAKPATISMLPLAVPAVRRWLTPNVDWVKHWHLFYGISIVLTVLGIGALIARGANFLDIEFRSGTQVTFNLATGKTLSIEEVRKRLDDEAGKVGLKELAGDNSTVQTVGETEVRNGKTHGTSFTIITLAGGENKPGNDANAVSSAIRTAFADVLDIQSAITADGMNKEGLEGAPVHPIKTTDLGAAIGRPEISEKVADYVGGVAIVLDNLTPAQPVQEIRKRINSVQFSPMFEKYGARPFDVIPLDIASHGQGGEPDLCKSVVIVARDEQVSYADTPETFDEKEGLAATEWRLVKEALHHDVSLASVSNFSSQVSGTMKQQAIVAIVLSWIAILVYIWFRFGDPRYGLGAVIALIHDVVIAIGMAAFAFYLADTALGRMLGITPFRLNLSMIASALTLIGFSVNDTIVVFDRIRENRGRLAFASPAIINASINQTLSRTLLTSGTAFISTLVLYCVGGEGVHGFIIHHAACDAL